MKIEISVIIIIALIAMNESKLVIKSNSYCNMVSNGCSDLVKNNLTKKECIKPQKCHGSHSLHCANSICAINKFECNEFLKIKKMMKSKSFKIDLHQKNNYNRLLNHIGNCAPNVFNYQEKDICLNKKICHTIRGKSILFDLDLYKKPNLVRNHCSCNQTSHKYECPNTKYCVLDIRTCDEFKRIGSMHPKKAIKIKSCEYN